MTTPHNSAAVSIAGVRQAWLDAVEAGDAARLAALVTDDVVVVHGNGRCVRGKNELQADFRKGFEAFVIRQRVFQPEVVIRGQWAFEISEVETRLSPRGGGEPSTVRSTAVVALRQQADGSWKVVRGFGVVHSAGGES